MQSGDRNPIIGLRSKDTIQNDPSFIIFESWNFFFKEKILLEMKNKLFFLQFYLNNPI